MFIIPKILVEDKKLPEVLRALAGKVAGMDTPQPVITNGANGNSMTSMEVLQTLRNPFRTKDLADALESHGFSRKSAPSLMNSAKEQGIAKSLGGGSWRHK